MEPPTRILDPDARPNKVPLSFPNGTLKKHQLPRPPPPPQTADLLYRECLKNHAASLGGHALDGCGEFMPSPSANPADPTSIKCAACGCHRNFHRRLPEPHHHHHQGEDDEQEGEDEMDGGEHMDNDDGGGDGGGEGERRRSSSSSPPYFSSAPHMLLALSTSLPGAPGPGLARPIPPAVGPGTVVGPTPGAAAVAVAVLPRKRFRSKFSPEQKGRMQELSERLGWRMQKRDEGLVEEFCREIGVGKGVFKVWMHNNKHNFVPGSSRRGEVGSSSSSGAVGINCDGVGVAVGSASASAAGGGLEASGNGGAGNTHAVNGSSSSS